MASVHPRSVRNVRLICTDFGYRAGPWAADYEPGQLPVHYAFNFLVFGAFSPLKTRSAPKAFPLAGQPYFGPKALFHAEQELPPSMMTIVITINKRVFDFFIVVYLS